MRVKETADPAPTKATEIPEAPPNPPPRRWLRRLLIAAVLLVILVVFHAPLLRFVAGLLVVDDPLVQTDVVVMCGMSGPYRTIPVDEMADVYNKGLAREILLIEDRSSRIVKAGIVPTVESVLRKELTKHDIPLTALAVTSGKFRTAIQVARPLRDWLDAHPKGHMTLLSVQLDSRRSAHVIHSELGPALAERIHWRSLPDKRFNIENWWHTRPGIVEVLGAYVALVHTYVIGEPSDLPRRWDPDEYERDLRQ